MTMKTVLITGGSRGIGAATAAEFGKNGYRVLLTYKNRASAAKELQSKLNAAGGDVHIFRCDMADTAQIPSGYLAAVLKAAGITLLTQLTADTCRDAGETALAAKAELVGRVLLLAVAVPLFQDLLTLVTALMSGQEAGG